MNREEIIEALANLEIANGKEMWPHCNEDRSWDDLSRDQKLDWILEESFDKEGLINSITEIIQGRL